MAGGKLFAEPASHDDVIAIVAGCQTVHRHRYGIADRQLGQRIIELDAGDLRSGYVVLVGMPMNPEAADTSRERIAEVLAQADEAITLGVDNWASYRIRPTALQRAFELELLETPFDQVLDEEAEARKKAMRARLRSLRD